MAMEFYADESETAGKVFTLAGFMASPSGWDRFVPKWRQMLADTGPYPVDSFHSADIEQARAPFDGWPPDARGRLVENAVTLLTDTTLCANLYAVGCTFVLEDLHPALSRNIADLYEYAYRVLFFNILEKWPAFNGVVFVFDQKDKVRGRVQTHFQTARRQLDADPRYAGKLGDCAFQDDRKVIPLQAADLLAYEMRRHTWMRTLGQETTRSAYARIKETFLVKPERRPYRQRVFRCYDRRFLIGVAQEIDRNPPEDESAFIDLWYHYDAPED